MKAHKATILLVDVCDEELIHFGFISDVYDEEQKECAKKRYINPDRKTNDIDFQYVFGPAELNNFSMQEAILYDNLQRAVYWAYLQSKHPNIKRQLKRGDIVENVKESGYRSDGIKFYDGEKLIEKETKIDSYGTPPSEFLVLREFPPNYWSNESPTINKKQKKKMNEDRMNENNMYVPNGRSMFYWHSDDVYVAVLKKDIPVNPIFVFGEKRYMFDNFEEILQLKSCDSETVYIGDVGEFIE